MKTHEIKSLTGRVCSRRSWCAMLAASAVALACLTLWSSRAVGANRTAFSGQATVVNATVLGQEIVLADTGPLPSQGGAAEDSLLEAEVPGLLSAEVLHASTVGRDNYAESQASVANLDLTVGANTISADFLMARARAECQGSQASVSGGSEIAVLVINGQTIAVAGSPNQTVNLPNGRVVINEQQAFVDDKFGDITVNALHVTILDPLTGAVLADVVISSAHADITCAGPPPPAKDFVTGGGWITHSGAKANFGVAGGFRSNGALFGHLSYIDHSSGLKVKATSITAYAIVDDTTRRIDGMAEINGQASFTFSVIVSDKGEPGRNDTFTISLSNGYSASGKLGGGNIQLHD